MRTPAAGPRAIRRRRGLGLAVLVIAIAGVTVVLINSGAGRRHGPASAASRQSPSPASSGTATQATTSTATSTAVAPPQPTRVATRVLRLVDPTRTIQTATGQTVPRTVVTIVRYPVTGPSGATGADGQRPHGALPLIVFGHGFAVTPAPYARLLDAWTKAGYVVAAPVFPLENARAPGGPNERDLVNQPADMSLVITSLLAASRAPQGPLHGLIDPRHLAVAGQSDGGDTALAAAYDPTVRDRRVGAAIILSGAEDPFAPAFALAHHGPPLLAIQGTDDPINPPNLTYTFFAAAPRPKFLLKLVGAGHLPPYAVPGPQLNEVERVTIAFLDYYFKGRRGALRRYTSRRTVGGPSILVAEP